MQMRRLTIDSDPGRMKGHSDGFPFEAIEGGAIKGEGDAPTMFELQYRMVGKDILIHRCTSRGH